MLSLRFHGYVLEVFKYLRKSGKYLYIFMKIAAPFPMEISATFPEVKGVTVEG